MVSNKNINCYKQHHNFNLLHLLGMEHMPHMHHSL